jgi:hypothetical protein
METQIILLIYFVKIYENGNMRACVVNLNFLYNTSYFNHYNYHHQSVSLLRQFRSPCQSDFFRESDLELPLSNSSILSFP